MITNILSLVTQTSTGGFRTFGLWNTSNSFLKIPINLSHLVNRINNLASNYNINVNLHKFKINESGIIAAKIKIKGKGGIYIWYCHITGLFYLGSAEKFFGTNGRLSTYLSQSRLQNNAVNKSLAVDILRYGYANYTLIIVEQYEQKTVPMIQLRTREQFWILLYPTYNKTLAVNFVSSHTITEQNRRIISNSIYQYEVDKNGILPNSETIHYGIKALCRTGFSSMNNPGVLIKISYFDLNVLLITGEIYLGQYIFTTNQLTLPEIIRWQKPFKYAENYEHLHNVANTLAQIKTTAVNTPVWIYKFVKIGHHYTKNDFVELVPQVKFVESRYNIPKMTLQRIRKFRAPSKGFIFSNAPLHPP